MATARIPELDEEDGTVDVGYGLRPDLVGQGLGHAFVTAILDFALNEFSPRRLVASAEGEFLVMTRSEPG